MLVLFPLLTLAMTALWVVLAKVTHKASIASITVAIVFPISVVLVGHEAGDVAVITIMALLVIARHLSNLRRLVKGQELGLLDRRDRRTARRRRRTCCELTGSVELVTDAARPTTVKKAVIPTAGLGTRFLPATKSQPKEMLPVVDKPSIQYVVEEAVAAGLTDILIITGRGKRAIEDHFDRNFELEHSLSTGRSSTCWRRCRTSTSSPTSTTSASGIPSASGTQ